MSSLPQSTVRGRVHDGLWHARVRCVRRLPLVVTVGVILIVVRTGLPGAPKHSVPPMERPPDEPWRDWRERLAIAHGHRRAGRIDEALLAYDRVTRAVTARMFDRYQARFWHARLRIERGETSALIDLRELVRMCDDPLLVARAGVLAARVVRDSVSSTMGPTMRSTTCTALITVGDARSSLRAMARVSNEHGQRAARWLEYFERACVRSSLP